MTWGKLTNWNETFRNYGEVGRRRGEAFFYDCEYTHKDKINQLRSEVFSKSSTLGNTLRLGLRRRQSAFRTAAAAAPPPIITFTRLIIARVLAAALAEVRSTRCIDCTDLEQPVDVPLLGDLAPLVRPC